MLSKVQGFPWKDPPLSYSEKIKMAVHNYELKGIVHHLVHMWVKRRD